MTMHDHIPTPGELTALPDFEKLTFSSAGQGEKGPLFEEKCTNQNQYGWLDEYLLSMPGVTKDFKVEWEWWRYHVGGKMFAATMHPSKKYAQEYADKDLISLKCEPLMAELLRKTYPEILPGFYTDKTNWNSIYLGGDVPDALMRKMCCNSYQLIFAKLTKKLQHVILGE